MLAVIAIGTSCNENNTKPTYSTFVTAVEGSWDIPYYIVFDDGTTAAVENYKIWTPSFTEDWKELRYIIYYTEVGLGIDFTARDRQREAIVKGLPWEMCKGFDRSAGLSNEFVSLEELGKDIQDLRFEMTLNGEVRQSGWSGDMIFSVDEIIAHVSKFMTLKMGDLIYTGTPVGVGPVAPGDRLVASLEGRTLLDFDIR